MTPDIPDKLDPFLKWAGGKRWLAKSGELQPPLGYRRYFEPFLGGGAMFFHLRPGKAILSDLNPDLIELYQVMRDHAAELHSAMAGHHEKHNADYYYKVRSSVPTGSVGRAARTLYLNRTCWNGLYRVNQRGEFNVPIGTKTRVLFPGESFGRYAEALSSATLVCSDFEATISEAREGDFLFVDPPYTARHNKNGFLKYNESMFSWDDQVRLHSSVVSAAARGAAVAVTNADHASVLSLYEGAFAYRKLHRASVLAGRADCRGATTEALFTANL
ncbi:MAG TPA: Dam family site-specific DNA-(adenine-N6)-methyltransferase [Devosia sp.]|nr:Dam family site-specific DNA-(adenine-N6)-methyltransferase [Devosia sp.]